MKFMNCAKKYAATLPLACGAVSVISFPVFAADAQTVVTAADWSSVITALTSQISVSTIVAALATFVAAGIGIAFMWWGLRKGIRSLMGVFRSGRLSI